MKNVKNKNKNKTLKLNIKIKIKTKEPWAYKVFIKSINNDYLNVHFFSI